MPAGEEAPKPNEGVAVGVVVAATAAAAVAVAVGAAGSVALGYAVCKDCWAAVVPYLHYIPMAVERRRVFRQWRIRLKWNLPRGRRGVRILRQRMWFFCFGSVGIAWIGDGVMGWVLWEDTFGVVVGICHQ